MATILTQADTARPATGGYKVDISGDQRIGRVSSEWFSRPDDECFLSLSSLYAAVKARADGRDAGRQGGGERKSQFAPYKDKSIPPARLRRNDSATLFDPIEAGSWMTAFHSKRRSI